MEQESTHFILTFGGQLLAIFPAAALMGFLISDLYPWTDEEARAKVSTAMLYFSVCWVLMDLWALAMIAPQVSAGARFLNPIYLRVLEWGFYVSLIGAVYFMLTAKSARLFTAAHLVVALGFAAFVYLASCLAVTGRWF